MYSCPSSRHEGVGWSGGIILIINSLALTVAQGSSPCPLVYIVGQPPYFTPRVFPPSFTSCSALFFHSFFGQPRLLIPWDSSSMPIGRKGMAPLILKLGTIGRFILPHVKEPAVSTEGG